MKKSNWLIFAILVLAAAFFLWLWYYLKFDLIDNPRDLVLTIVWWAVVALCCIVIQVVEKKRQERVRTTYVNKVNIFNSEAGTKPIGQGSCVELIQDTLADLKYNFNTEEFPTAPQTRFDFIVRSKKFKFDKKSDDTIEVKKWEGNVSRTNHPDEEPKEFKNRAELQGILGCA